MGEALVSCDTFVVMADSTDTTEVTHSHNNSILHWKKIYSCRSYLAKTPTVLKVIAISRVTGESKM